MKRYPNTKKFLLWFFLILVLLIISVVIWRSLERASSMRPPERARQEKPPVKNNPQEPETEPAAPGSEEAETEVSLQELAKHPHFGWPASPYQVLELIEFKAFSLAYDEQHEQPAWVAYRLAAQGKRKRHERYDRFMADSQVSTGSATPEDYANSGFDRGHLAPAADFATDKQALKETFYMSNMSPQDPSFNRGIWSKLENQVRDWAEEQQEVWVVTGPVLLSQAQFKQIGENKVSIPLFYYKVVLDVQEPEIKMIAMLLPNKGSSEPLASFVVTVDSLESMTGLDFFPMLPDELEETLEGQKNAAGWF